MPNPIFSDGVLVPSNGVSPEIDQTGATLENVKYPPRRDWYANQTQVIANRLPQWNKIRRQKQSIGQTVLNASMGRHLVEVEEFSEKAFRSNYLQLVSLDEPDVVSQVTIPERINLDTPQGLINFVPNSYFQIWSYPHQLPDGWVTSTTNTTVVTGLQGHNALRLGVGSSSTSSVYQDIKMRTRPGESWVASVFYKIATNVLVKPASGFGLKVTGTRSDGVTESTEVVFEATTVSEWYRATRSVSFTQEVVSVRIEVIISDTGSFLFAGNTVDIDCFQLEVGTQVRPWRPRIDDRYPYMRSTSNSPVFVGGSDSAVYVSDVQDFWEESFPNRSSYVNSEPAAVSALTAAGAFEVTDFFKRTYTFAYEIVSGKLRFRDQDHQDDILRDFYLAFRNADGDYQIKDGFILEGITFFAGYLWVVGTNTDFGGNTIRAMYVVEPMFPWPAPTYLQVKAGVLLPSTLSLTDPIIRIEFRNEDRQHLYLFTATQLHVIRLYYDIYTISGGSRLLFLREKYTSVVVS